MIIRNLYHLLQMLLLAAIQVLVFNHIHLFGFATPLVYVAFLLYFPLDSSRIGILLWGFAMGLLMDVFSNTPGVAASAMTLAALLQPIFLHLMVPKDAVEDMTPNYQTMGRWNHIRFATIIVLAHNLMFFAMESFSYFDPRELLITMGSSFVLTLVLVLVIETFRGTKPDAEHGKL